MGQTFVVFVDANWDGHSVAVASIALPQDEHGIVKFFEPRVILDKYAKQYDMDRRLLRYEVLNNIPMPK